MPDINAQMAFPPMIRWLLAGLLFVLTACGNLSEPSSGPDNSQAVLETAFRQIDRRYAAAASIEEMSIAGLKAVASAVPSARLRHDMAGVALAIEDVEVGRWPTPSAHDHVGWATVVADAIHLLQDAPSVPRPADPEASLKLFFDSALAGLDKYTRYSTPTEALNARARRDGFGGLGITIRHDDDGSYVSTVHPDTPAERSGLKAGDRITHIGKTAVSTIDRRAVVERLRGPVHSSVDLTVRRDAVPSPLQFSIVRAHIILPTVISRTEDGFLYIKISGFNQGTSRALGRSLAEAESTGAAPLKGILLDLRANPGGLLDQAVAIADLFLNDGRVISTRGRHHRANQIFDASWGERVRGLPIALLVNGRSASASEIVAAALRDRGRAIVVGTSSFGKGSVQNIIRLPNGGELTMTWAHLIAPSGFNLQGHGVIPAICTSAGDLKLQPLMAAMRDRSAAAAGAFVRMLESRQAVRKDPEKARKDCPPTDELSTGDVEIAKYILGDRTLYARALSDGGPAIAETRP